MHYYLIHSRVPLNRSFVMQQALSVPHQAASPVVKSTSHYIFFYINTLLGETLLWDQVNFAHRPHEKVLNFMVSKSCRSSSV